MAQTTEFDDEMSREEAADYLRSVADELDREDGASVQLGNKRVEVRPPESIRCKGKLTERSRLLGSDREELTVTLSWKASKG